MEEEDMSAEAMTGERMEIDLAAPPARVYEAIATADGVKSWWTDGTFAEEVGGIGRLSFGHGWTELRIERLVPEREVEWSCVGQGWSHYIGVSLKGLVERGEAAAGPGAGSD
jgi:uncharacterized protein YndB with AHSA1/START domain